MQVLSKKSLPLGGFAGLTEHRLVTDRRVFGGRKAPNTFDGLGNFVYLADAQFNARGETHMHSHKEIDVISIMVAGRVSHEGSLELGQSLMQAKPKFSEQVVKGSRIMKLIRTILKIACCNYGFCQMSQVSVQDINIIP